MLGASAWQYWRYDRAADPLAERPRRRPAAVRQRLRRDRHGLCADRLLVQHRADPALRPDPRRRAARPQSRLCAGARHAGDHRRSPTSLISPCAPAPSDGSDEARPARRLARRRSRRALFPRSARRDLRILAAHAPRRIQLRRLPRRVRQRQFPGLVPLFDHRLRWSTIVVGGADRRAGRLFRAAAAAAPAGDRRVHHAPAAGHSGDRAGVRLHPALRQLVAAAADRDLRSAPTRC